MSYCQHTELNIVVVPKAISDNYSSIGLKKITTPGYLETILSPQDILFYRFLNSFNGQISRRTGINSNKQPVSFDLNEKTTIYEQLMDQYGGTNNPMGEFAKAMHNLVYGGIPQFGGNIGYTVLGMEDNNVVLGLTNDPNDPRRVKSVSDFIITFYEHYGLESLSRGSNHVYLERLVELAI